MITSFKNALGPKTQAAPPEAPIRPKMGKGG